MDNENKKHNDTILIRAGIAFLILFAASTPVSVTVLQGLPVLEAVWVAFAISAITVLFVMLVGGIISECVKRVRAISESSVRAIRGEREAGEAQAMPAA